MEKNKLSAKALKGLVNDSVREAIAKLELPKANKKLQKLIDKSSKKIAEEFSTLLKKEEKKKKKAEKSLTFIEDVLSGKEKKKKERNEKKSKKNGVKLSKAATE